MRGEAIDAQAAQLAAQLFDSDPFGQAHAARNQIEQNSYRISDYERALVGRAAGGSMRKLSIGEEQALRVDAERELPGLRERQAKLNDQLRELERAGAKALASRPTLADVDAPTEEIAAIRASIVGLDGVSFD